MLKAASTGHPRELEQQCYLLTRRSGVAKERSIPAFSAWSTLLVRLA